MVTGIIGRKLGMTQIFDPDGTIHPATVIKAGPCVVVQAKTAQAEGYAAVQLGLVEERPMKASKPVAGLYKKAGVLSGGERTRLAVARMLLRPSNLLLLDEPTNHLDLDSKDVLLDALVDYGGTLIFVSHDRYFVERLATRIIEVGHGKAESFPGTYPEFLWRKEHQAAGGVEIGHPADSRRGARSVPLQANRVTQPSQGTPPAGAHGVRRAADHPDARTKRVESQADRKAALADQRRRDRERKARQARLADLESRISAHESAIKALESEMADPGFYAEREAAEARLARHQSLMWEVGELMQQWEMLSETDESEAG